MQLGGPPSIQEPFRPHSTVGYALRSSEAGGRGVSGSILQALSPTACRRRTKKLRRARVQRKHPFWFPPAYFGIRGLPAGTPGAEAIRKPGPQIHPSCSLPASLSEGARPQRRAGSEPQLHSSRRLRGTVQRGRSENDRPGGIPSLAASPAALALPQLGSALPSCRPQSTRGPPQPLSRPGSAGRPRRGLSPAHSGPAQLSLSPRPPQPAHRCRLTPASGATSWQPAGTVRLLGPELQTIHSAGLTWVGDTCKQQQRLRATPSLP